VIQSAMASSRLVSGLPQVWASIDDKDEQEASTGRK
jgi:hypothetical protein